MMYLRRSGSYSPTEKGRAPSKAVVLSDAHSPVSAADPLSANPPSTPSTVSGAKRSRTRHFPEHVPNFSKELHERINSVCAVPPACVSASSPVRQKDIRQYSLYSSGQTNKIGKNASLLLSFFTHHLLQHIILLPGYCP